jgi:4-hydroxy-4-methyl-2-oxoglutarate aldolase
MQYHACEEVATVLVEDFIAALRGVDSATVSMAVEELGVRNRTEGYADLRLRCLLANPEPMVGFAVTFTVDSTTPDRTPGDMTGYYELMEAVDRSPRPCVAVIQEAGPHPERGCHMGDVVGTHLARKGAVGVVSGSGIRDLDGLRTLGLSAFALGTVVGHGVWTITSVGEEVDVAGLRVRTGDLLHGNQDGLVTIPDCDYQELLDHIEKVQAHEAWKRAPREQAARS